MKSINKTDIKNINYRFPEYNTKNLSIFNNSFSDFKKLYNRENKYFVLKPRGKKSLLWFTYIGKNIHPILIVLNNNDITHETNEFYIFDIEFHNTLCYNNVLLYGYYFKHNGNNYFIIENVYNYNEYNKIIKHNDYHNNFKKRLAIIHKISQNINTKKNFVIKIPLIYDNLDSFLLSYNNINYNIYCVSIYSNHKFNGNFIIQNRDKKNKYQKTATFSISALLEDDIYALYTLEKNEEKFYDLALIDSYKTSKFMNQLFRKIKENKNLDLLEMSDSEEEFEDTDISKYVDLEKKINIECGYNEKFKKWIPLNISKDKIVSKNYLNLANFKKKYFHNI